jgi:hypothetical protein
MAQKSYSRLNSLIFKHAPSTHTRAIKTKEEKLCQFGTWFATNLHVHRPFACVGDTMEKPERVLSVNRGRQHPQSPDGEAHARDLPVRSPQLPVCVENAITKQIELPPTEIFALQEKSTGSEEGYIDLDRSSEEFACRSQYIHIISQKARISYLRVVGEVGLEDVLDAVRIGGEEGSSREQANANCAMVIAEESCDPVEQMLVMPRSFQLCPENWPFPGVSDLPIVI